MAKRIKKEMPQWMKEWYRDSPGGSVIADYESGNVKVIEVK